MIMDIFFWLGCAVCLLHRRREQIAAFEAEEVSEIVLVPRVNRRKQVHGSTKTEKNEKKKNSPRVERTEVCIRPVSGKQRTYQAYSTPCVNKKYFSTSIEKKYVKLKLTQIIHREAPVCESVLRKRFCQICGIRHPGQKMKAAIDECLSQDFTVTQCAGERIFWAKEQTPLDYRFYRVAKDDQQRRQIKEIPPEELANAMYEVLLNINICPTEKLFCETIKLFGFKKVSAGAGKFLNCALDILEQRGCVDLE